MVSKSDLPGGFRRWIIALRRRSQELKGWCLHSRMIFSAVREVLKTNWSFRAIPWRFEAFRTGQPFGEVVLTRSLDYRVQQVFLIHYETSLPILHIAASGARYNDPALISAMLSAILDFTSSSFPNSRGLDTIAMAKSQVWIERGPKAILAAAIIGAAPIELRSVFQDAVDRIHNELIHELDAFPRGADDCAEAARPYLEACLLGRLLQH